MASAHTKEFTTDNFDAEALGAQVPVLVDFWAEWCPPCRALGPTIDTVAERLAGEAVVGKVDVDANQELAARYGISSIPTMIVFQGGQEVARLQGLQPEDAIVQAIDGAKASAG